MNTPRSYLGIDFSGNDANWRPSAGQRTNVWIAEAVADGETLRLVRLDRVQQRHPGAARPFEALARELGARRFDAAGIDAPFSVPAAHVPGADHAVLLRLARSVDREPKRSFARGAELRAAIASATHEPATAKPLRETERYWAERKVNTRSTLWAGARPGASMTAACLELLARSAAPLWPWVSDAPGVLTEAFPAAQLRTWKLPFAVYDASKDDVGARANRRTIVDGVATRIDLGHHRSTMLDSADAIDAVVSLFAGVAVRRGRLERQPTSVASLEGCIAVHA
jgi:hypothetical protein